MAVMGAQQLVTFWRNQQKNWRTVVIRRIFNRFFNQLTMDYANIYVRELGASPVELGSLNSIAGFGSTLLSIPIGLFHDKFSLKKLFVFGSSLVAIASFLYAIAQNWIMVIPAIILTKITMRFHCSVICDLSLESESRATGKSLCEGLGSTPSLFAPLVAASLITFFGGQISVEGIRPLYWIQFLAHTALFLYIVMQLTEVVREHLSTKQEESSLFGGLKEVFNHGSSLKRWIAFYALSMFSMNMVTPFWYPYVNEVKNADQYIIGVMATVGIFVKILLATPLGRLADRMGRKKVYYALNPIIALANLALILSPASSYFLIIPALLRGFNTVSQIVIIGAMTPELISPRFFGRWRGILGLFGGLVSIIAPIVGGIIWETVGPSHVFIIAMFTNLFITLPLMITIPETLQTK